MVEQCLLKGCVKYIGIVAASMCILVGPSLAQDTQLNDYTPDCVRPWTIDTSISMRRLGSNDLLDFLPNANRALPVFADDGKYFAVTQWNGDLSDDANKVEVLVYETAAVNKWLESDAHGSEVKPYEQLRFESLTSNWEKVGISSLQWSNNTLFFVAPMREKVSSHKEFFRYDPKSRRLSRVTRTSGDIYDALAAGKGVVWRELQIDPPEKQAYPAQLLALGSNGKALFLTRNKFSLFIKYANKRPIHLPIEITRKRASGNALSRYVFMSPDGALAFISGEIAGNWSLSLVNAKSGKLRIVQGKNVQPFGQVSWSADSSKAVLTTFDKSRPKSALRLYTVATGKFEDILQIAEGNESIEAITWVGDFSVIVTVNNNGIQRMLQIDLRTGGIEQPDKQPEEPPLKFQVVEDANNPQKLVVSNELNSKVLGSADPALRGVCRATQVPISWKEGAEEVFGGLTLPRSWEPGKRVPLVVQPYFYLPNLFLPDGDNSSIDAAQLLAAAGFAVLKYQIPSSTSTTGEVNELSQVRNRFDAAVGAVVDGGFVDADRIAVTGFSRSGFHTLGLITSPGKFRIAAAVRGDAFTGSYPSYLVTGAFAENGDDRARLHESFSENSSFWNDPEDWLKTDPLFLADNNAAALLEVNHGRGSRKISETALTTLDVVGAMALNRKPVEYYFLPDGYHQLVRPAERAFMLSAVVDWMDFWLQGHERTESVEEAGETKEMLEEKYARWRKMRDEWEIQQAWEAAGNPPGSVPDPDFRAN